MADEVEGAEEAKIIDSNNKSGSDNTTNAIDLDDFDIKVEYQPNDYAKNLAAANTGTSSAPLEEDEEGKNASGPSEKKSSGDSEEEQDGEEWSEEDLRDGAEFTIEFLDAISANACKAIAKEEDPTQFELTPNQKSRLTKILTRIFIKYQVKMGPMAALILALLMYFGLNFKDAYSIRMKKKTDEEEKQQQLHKQKKKQQQQKIQTVMMAKLGEKELTLSELSGKMKMDEKMVRKMLKSFADQDLIVVNDTEMPNKYKVAA